MIAGTNLLDAIERAAGELEEAYRVGFPPITRVRVAAYLANSGLTEEEFWDLHWFMLGSSDLDETYTYRNVVSTGDYKRALIEFRGQRAESFSD